MGDDENAGGLLPEESDLPEPGNERSEEEDEGGNWYESIPDRIFEADEQEMTIQAELQEMGISYAALVRGEVKPSRRLINYLKERLSWDDLEEEISTEETQRGADALDLIANGINQVDNNLERIVAALADMNLRQERQLDGLLNEVRTLRAEHEVERLALRALLRRTNIPFLSGEKYKPVDVQSTLGIWEGYAVTEARQLGIYNEAEGVIEVPAESVLFADGISLFLL